MFDFKWSSSEKKIAREAYNAAWLREQRKDIGEMFDYRYSQLPVVFARAIRMGHMEVERLAGLSEDKLKMIRSLRDFSPGG
ncbi:MAG TPA: hypothetical protein VHX61_09890 [Rhizomicrobium sp.]|jgi:hypothetical protein|nr:hypothetical protein [Rhizomicrobium sp.]